MFKKLLLCLSLYVSLYAFEEKSYDISVYKNQDLEIFIYTLNKEQKHGYMVKQGDVFAFKVDAKKDKMHLSGDFGICDLKEEKLVLKAKCKIENEKQNFLLKKLDFKAQIYKLKLSENIKDNGRTYEFNYSHALLKSKNLKIQKIFDEFNENLDEAKLRELSELKLKNYKDKEEYFDNESIIDVNIAYMDENFISLAKNIYEYKGGAHGMQFVQRQNYDLKNNKWLDLNEELKLDDENFKNFVKKKILQEKDRDDLYNLDDFKISSIFEIRKNGIIMIWEPYEIAPYSSGVIELFLNFEEIKPFLKDKSLLINLK